MVNDLLRALEAYQTFKQTRLDDDPPSVKFHDKMTKQRLKTFSTIGTKTARTKGQNVVLKADRNLFSQMSLVAESRSVNMKDVLAHLLSLLPWALAHADGSLRKTNKAALARELEKNVSPAEAIPTPSTCIIDGMGLVQRMNGNNKTFAQLVESVLAMVLYVGGQSGRIDVVFDVYRQPSIKDSARLKDASTTVQYTYLARGHTIQQWRKFLSSSFNKMSLIKFLVGEWKGQRYRDMLQSKALYVTCEETCFKMTQMNGWKWRSCSPHKKKQIRVCFCMHCMLQELVRGPSSSQPKTPMSCLSGLPKGYPLSHLSEVCDTEPHTICRHQQTGLVIRRQHM